MFSFTHNHIGYRIKIPDYPANLFVDHYVFMEGHGLQNAERLFPNNKAELFFNLGGRVSGKSNSHVDAPDIKHSIVSGVRDTFFDFFPPEDFRMIGMRFTLFGFHQIFKVPAIDFTNNNYAAEDVFGAQVRDVREQLFGAHGCSEMFSMMQDWIISLITGDSLSEAAVWNKTEKILSNSNLPVSELLNSYLGYSHRHSIQLIRDQSGLSPKDIRKIVRLDGALRRISHMTTQNWSALALASGYSDQSHFIRDFKSFTGYTPREYVRIKPHEFFFHEMMPDQQLAR